MKKSLCLLALFAFFCIENATAQCGGGKTKCSLNWDYLQFFPSSGISSYTTLAHSQTQNFTFGTQKLNIVHNYTGSNAPGEDATNTAEAGSFGTGEDVHFLGNGVITFTFAAAVDSVKFSLYDIDYNQRVVISSATIGTVVNMAKVSGSTLAISNNLTSAARVDANNTTVNNTNTNGSLNVVITNPVSSVTTFTITVTNTGTTTGETGDFWLSDISACSAGTFTNNYYQVAKPFTNQAGYIVTSRNDSFYFINPANGAAKFIFTDPSGQYANSVAYDPVRHEIYYAFSLTLPGPAIDPNNKTIRRYNYDKDTFGVVIPDITVFAPVFEQGIESGAAAFYDGSLYLGIEASATGSNESAVWKIGFNASGNPITAAQVYAAPGAGRDWGDIAVVNGTLVDFDSRPASPNYFHQDLYTKAVTTYSPTGADVPRQAAVDWNNVIYNIGGSANSYVVGGVTIATGTIATYNGNGTINVASIDTIKTNGVAEMGSWGDAGEAFKPRVDYGDAPASFDPVTGDPAVHELNKKLYLGTNTDDEWASRGQTTFANSDNFDDGVTIGSLVNPSAGTFTASVKFFNNTGATATICAWVDFNNNGKFDAVEGIAKTLLPSSASSQTVWLNWSGVSTTLVSGSYTYLRVRITSTANAMTVNNATGFFDIGEVEDYRLAVTSYALETRLVKFDAVKNADGRAVVSWEVANEEAGMHYTVQRSTDGAMWTDVATNRVVAGKASNVYSYTDAKPLSCVVYYRLCMTKNAAASYGEIKKIETVDAFSLQLQPNPASSSVWLVVNTGKKITAQLFLYDISGRRLFAKNITLAAGSNSIPLDVSRMSAGTYWVQMVNDEKQSTEKLVIEK